MLESLQRSLAQLVRTGTVTERPAEPVTADYLQVVAGATGLRVMREVVHEWRLLLLRQGCPLTTGALIGEGAFVAAVGQFMREESLDPLAQSLASGFLVWAAKRRDDDIGSLAQFEHALIAVRRGTSSASVVVTWKCQPMDAIAAALHARPMPKPHPSAIYTTEIAEHLPGSFTVRY